MAKKLSNSFKEGIEIRSSCVVWNIASNSLILSRKNRDMSFYYLATGIIFSAFSFEAMMNHYAYMLFEDWDKEEKKLKPREKKFKKILDELKLSYYYKTNDYSVIKECLKIRDEFAHGKTAFISRNLVQKSIVGDFNNNSNINKYLFDDVINYNTLDTYLKTINALQDSIEINNPGLNQYPLNVSGDYFI